VNRCRVIIGLTVFVTLSALCLGFFVFSTATMELLYRRTAFYFIFAATAVFVQQLLRLYPGNTAMRQFAGRHLFAVVTGLLLVFLARHSSPPDFRILADETNLLGISRAMYLEHGCYNPTQALNCLRGFTEIVGSSVDMRPAFFPFLVYALHAVSGYSHNNAFLINALAGFASLFIFYLLVQGWYGRCWGIVAMLAMAAYPLFVVCMTSAGFEMVNLAAALLLFLLVRRFCEAADAVNAESVFLLLPLLAQTRYESALAVVVAVLFVWHYLPWQQYCHFSWRIVVLPLMFVPVCWLRLLTYGSQSFQVSSVDEAFGLSLFWRNLCRAVPFFYGAEANYGMIGLLAFMAVAGSVWILIDWCSRDNALSPDF
jgi:hypothetical protein